MKRKKKKNAVASQEFTGRSEGAYLLAETGRTQDEIAATMNVSRIAVHKWLHGEAAPEPKKRRKLERVFGIPVESWDRPAPKKNGIANANAPPLVGDVDIFDLADRIQRQVTTLVHELETEKMTRLERSRSLRELSYMLPQLAKIRGESDLGRHVMKFPIWKRIRAAIIGALRDHPEALAKVVDAIREAEEKARSGT